jgi:hypothetical protein
VGAGHHGGADAAARVVAGARIGQAAVSEAVVGAARDADELIGPDGIRCDERIPVVVGVLLIDKTIAVVIDAVAQLVSPGVDVGVVVIAVVVGGVVVAVHVVGTGHVGDAALGDAVATVLRRPREGMGVVVVAVDGQVLGVAAGERVREAVSIGVAGHAGGAGGGRTALAGVAVAVRVLLHLRGGRGRIGGRQVAAQPAQRRGYRAAAFFAFQIVS